MGGGGGGQTGGVVVGGPTPDAAMLAGLYQQNAATAAAQAAQQQTNSAINLLREQYGNAFMALKPYTSEGLQAINELNSYMGLGAYNPGTAPTTPVKKTWQDYAADITSSQIKNYINQNVSPANATDPRGGGDFIHPQYTGVGSEDPELQKQYSSNWGPVKYPGGVTSANSVKGSNVPDGIGGSGIGSYATAFYNDPKIRQYAIQGIGEELAAQDNATFQSKMDNYNQQMDLYNQAKGLYDQYSAAGPLSPEQVQAKLMAQPGVAFQYTQGLDAIQRAAASKGSLNSGRLLQSLSDYGQGMASQQYGQTLSRLAALAGQGQEAAGGIANLSTNLGNAAGQLTSNLGDTMANSFLAKGNAMSQALLAANQRYQVIGQQDSGGGGMGGIGSLLSGIGSIAGSGLFKSSKTLKDKVSTPSTKEILQMVNNLDIDVWKYKETDVAHLGPYAEDLKDKLGVGDGKTVNVIDILGVLLGSVKELTAKIESLEKRNS